MSGETQSLLIDRAASARRLDPQEVRTWADGQRVFVSSVMDDYRDPRAAAARAIERVGAEPVMFERFGGRDSDPEGAYLAEVESSTIYVGLLGERYGRLLPSRFSATHAEYLHAEKCGLRLSVWTEDGAERGGRQQVFVDEVRTFNVTGSFLDPEDLQHQLETRLRAIAAEDLSPWIKLGRSLFRATEIQIAGDRASIRAVVRDHEVADDLASLTDRFGPSATTLAFWDGVYDAKVEGLSSVSRAGGSRELSIELSISPPQRQQEYSFDGVDYPDATKLAVEVSWFGRENPYGLMRSEAEIDNPFTVLSQLRIPEEAYRPIAFILAYEILARSRNVGRVTRFRLGPPIAGERRLELEWTQPSQYANQGRVTRSAEGEIPASRLE